MAEQYGKDLVKLYIIDDSDDETREEIDGLASRFSSAGYKIEVIRRGTRAGFKAGALQAALERTNEVFIAVFDADFCPPPDFLERTVPCLLRDSTVGFVQSRWSHFDRNYNMVTETLAIGVDAHFLLEQPGRWGSGYLMNFNGSAGLLRREAILKAGGWQSDTLAEDLDLSYRMQLAGYTAIYLRDLKVPAELPPTITSLKRQQGRWARGSIQTAKKVMPALVHSKFLSSSQKFQAVMHLTYYLVHPLMVASFLLAVIATFLNIDVIRYAVDISIPTIPRPADLVKGLTLKNATYFTFQVAPWLVFSVLVVLSTIAVLYYCAEAVRVQKMGLLRNVKQIFLLVVLGYGISISNSVNVLSGLLSNKTGTFLRTPKYAITRKDHSWREKKYQLSLNKVSLLEGGAVAVSALAITRAFVTSNFGIVPILAVYMSGYVLVFALTLLQSLGPSRATRSD
jgi:cellulose synthase/poly-beta-1,6-N-acetylglucosamine synthase-like glycosyltransferase